MGHLFEAGLGYPYRLSVTGCAGHLCSLVLQAHCHCWLVGGAGQVLWAAETVARPSQVSLHFTVGGLPATATVWSVVYRSSIVWGVYTYYHTVGWCTSTCGAVTYCGLSYAHTYTSTWWYFLVVGCCESHRVTYVPFWLILPCVVHTAVVMCTDTGQCRGPLLSTIISGWFLIPFAHCNRSHDWLTICPVDFNGVWHVKLNRSSTLITCVTAVCIMQTGLETMKWLNQCWWSRKLSEQQAKIDVQIEMPCDRLNSLPHSASTSPLSTITCVRGETCPSAGRAHII